MDSIPSEIWEKQYSPYFCTECPNTAWLRSPRQFSMHGHIRSKWKCESCTYSYVIEKLQAEQQVIIKKGKKRGFELRLEKMKNCGHVCPCGTSTSDDEHYAIYRIYSIGLCFPCFHHALKIKDPQNQYRIEFITDSNINGNPSCPCGDDAQQIVTSMPYYSSVVCRACLRVELESKICSADMLQYCLPASPVVAPAVEPMAAPVVEPMAAPATEGNDSEASELLPENDNRK